MLFSVETVLEFSVRTTDGSVEAIADFLFDDESWIVRYLVIDTQPAGPCRCVLLPPSSISRIDWAARLIDVSQTKQQLMDCPDMDAHKPVCRHQFLASLDHFTGLGYSESEAEYRLETAASRRVDARANPGGARRDDPHLQSGREVMTYRLRGPEGDSGQVTGFLIDDAGWTIRFLIVMTGRWRHGHPVLIEPASVTNVRWSDADVLVGLSRQAVERAPIYDRTDPADSDRYAPASSGGA